MKTMTRISGIVNKNEDAEREIEISKGSPKELISRGYDIMSYDGELCLLERERTKETVNDNGDLKLKGAEIFAREVLQHLERVEDVKIVKSGSAFDVYAKQREVSR